MQGHSAAAAVRTSLSAPKSGDLCPVLVAGLPDSEHEYIQKVLAGIRTFPCQAAFVDNDEEFLWRVRSSAASLLIVDGANLPANQIRNIALMIAEHPKLRHAPVIILCESGTEPGLQYCAMHCHGMFMRKSLPRQLLRANIEMALVRLRRETENERMRYTIEEAFERSLSELNVAKRILDNISNTGSTSTSHVRVHLQSLDQLNGDIALVQQAPTGKTVVLVGDFSGHGLTAAVGSMIAAEVFNAMARKGYGIGEIAAQINLKLHHTLPTGLYLAACLVELDVENQVMSIWNGGLPDVIVRSGSDVTPIQMTDGHPPLGVLDPSEFSSTLRRIAIHPGGRAYIYTDGLTEMRNANNQMWGTHSLASVIRATSHSGSVFDAILTQAAAHCGTSTPQDDVTLVELLCPEKWVTPTWREIPISTSTHPVIAHDASISTTSVLSLHIDAHSISETDVVPAVVQLVGDLKVGDEHRSAIFVILRELMTNAVDHGLLGLDSAMKSSAEGFDQYYSLRESRLAVLEVGYISLQLSRDRSSDGRLDVLNICVEDSGPGFNHRAIMEKAARHAFNSESMGGRGIALVQSLCSNVVYNNCGNTVRVVYNLATQTQ
ncbi:MAG: ATP-binding SpoIIE family protein phosphatase [Gammaproteobacteria bacterium]